MNEEHRQLREAVVRNQELLKAALLVLDDFRTRRNQTQAIWDRQEQEMVQNVAFYEGWVTNLESRLQAYEDANPPLSKRILDAVASPEFGELLQSGKRIAEALQVEALQQAANETQHGAITAAIESMLRSASKPVKARTLADMLVRRELKADLESAETSVRSALKNLKKQGKVYAPARGEYKHTRPLRLGNGAAEQKMLVAKDASE